MPIVANRQPYSPSSKAEAEERLSLELWLERADWFIKIKRMI